MIAELTRRGSRSSASDGIRPCVARLGLSTSTVSRRIKAGEIRTIKVGNRHRVPLSEYEAFRRRLMGQIVEHYADDLEADLVG